MTLPAASKEFETDFWKDANLRKIWDEIVPGEPRKTLPYTLTQEAIALYCQAVGETNPLYLDEAAAKAGPFGGLIAPPSIHILLMFACTPADDWMRSPGRSMPGSHGATTFPPVPATRSRLRRARSTNSSSASGCSSSTTTCSSISTAR